MYIMKRLSGGRGEYEIAETHGDLYPHSLLDLELRPVVGRYGPRPTRIYLREQGRKLRLRIEDGSTVHIHRQLAATAMLPKPTRDEATLEGGFPIVFLNRYVLRRLDFKGVELLPEVAQLTLGILEVDNGSASAQRFEFADRVARIERLHDRADVLPEALQKAVIAHRTLLEANRPLTKDAEDLVDRLMSLAQTEALHQGLEYDHGTDVLPALEGIAGLPSPSPEMPAPLPPKEGAPVGVVGGAYRAADEAAAVAEVDPFSIDPAIRERGLRGHATTQNALASYVTAQGLDPRSPRTGEPNFDLAWEDSETIFVTEVKSMTFSNEEKQMRLGVGQILRYRQIMERLGRPVIGVLAVENEPTDPGWKTLCNDLGIVLVWPPRIASILDDVRARSAS